MWVLDALKTRLTGKGKGSSPPRPGTTSPPIDFVPAASRFFGQGIGNQPSHEMLLQENLGVADMATRAIANRIASLEPLVKTSTRLVAGTLEDEILDDHPLKSLLDRPHPNFSRVQMLRLTAQYMVTVGEAYWLKVNSRLGVPAELHIIPPQNIWPVIQGGVIQRYTARDGDGQERSIDAGAVVRFLLPDPESPFFSEGYLGPAGVVADSLKFSSQHLRSHYQSDATPKTALEATETAVPFQDHERERFATEWRKRYRSRSGQDVGVPAILPSGYKLIQLAIQSGADITPLLEHWRDEQLMGFGVPRSVLGQVVSGDRSSAETNQYVFDLHTILPLARVIEDALSYQLAGDFDGNVWVQFAPFVSDDKDFSLRQEDQDIRTKVRTVNQVREDRGLDPVEWGDVPIGTISDVPYDADAASMFSEDMSGALEDEPDDEETEDEETEDEEPERVWSHRKALRLAFDPDVEWSRQVTRERKYTPAMRNAMAEIFRRQRADCLKRLKKVAPRSRVKAEDIFTPSQWAALFSQRVDPVRERAYLNTAEETMDLLPVSGGFVFTDAQKAYLKKQGALLVKQTGQTTQRLLRAQLIKAIDAGEGTDQIARRVRNVFTVRNAQARTIARTEILKAAQSAQVASFEQSGVVEKKQWNTSRDDAVRDDHRDADGLTVEMSEAFEVGGELFEAPGVGFKGRTPSAANVINCRCFVTPVIIED